MSESSNKRMKFTNDFPNDLVEHITSTFLPIQTVLQNRLVSKTFNDAAIQSRDLDFSSIYSRRRRKLKVVSIIEAIFNQHKGPEIKRFVMFLDHKGVEDIILRWVKTCIGKKIQELVLDFSKAKKVLEIAVDFSAIETLTVLKLRWCKFEIPGNSPKGLRLLKTLELMQTKVTKEMVDAIFNNCNHLESLELFYCRMDEVLSINAQHHKKFKVLVVFSIQKILKIVVDAPTLERFENGGYVRFVEFSRVDALKEAKLHYTRHNNWRYYDSSKTVIDNMKVYTGVHVLATTTIFLEALTYKYVGEGRMENPPFRFPNLKEFEISFQAPTVCNLFDIAEFIKHCPILEKVLIDIKNFTFQTDLFWKINHKPKLQKEYHLDSIKEVKIDGYKGHSHEVEIVEFFLKNAKSLKKLVIP